MVTVDNEEIERSGVNSYLMMTLPIQQGRVSHWIPEILTRRLCSAIIEGTAFLNENRQSVLPRVSSKGRDYKKATGLYV